MKRSLPLIAILLITTFAILKCTKTDNPGGDAIVTTSVKGRVIDVSKVPVSGATVTIGTSTTTTNINGEFRIDHVEMDKKNGFIKVKKTGFFSGSRTISTSSNTNYVSIQLIPKIITGNFAVTSGGNIPVAHGGSIEFSANSVVTSSGIAYTGNVSVAASYLDPTSPNINDLMPGDLRGTATSGSETSLQSFGMMVAELNGSNGEALQIAPGKTATITFSIPASLQSTAPASIPLWYFNEATGLWKEEGSATKQGNNYVGTVTHFTYWNCDLPVATINLDGTVVDGTGKAIANAYVIIHLPGSLGIGYAHGNTDSLGYFSGPVPAGMALVMDVYSEGSYNCNERIYSANIGPYDQNSSIGTVVANGVPLHHIQVSGSVTNCNGIAVTNGFALFHFNESYTNATIINGNYTAQLYNCSPISSVEVVVYDNDSLQQSDVHTVSISDSLTTIPVISACGISSDMYVNIVYGNEVILCRPTTHLMKGYYYDASQGGPGSEQTGIYANSYVSNGHSLEFFFNGAIGTGLFQLGHAYFYHFGEYNLNLPDPYLRPPVNITRFEGVGGYIEGNWSDTLRNSGTVPIIKLPFSVSFRVRRIQ